MGDAKQVKAVIQSIRQYSNFRQMAEYNISCLLTYITPPTVGWRENVAAAVEDGGIESIISVLAKHGNALDMVKQATTALSGLAISRDNAGRVAQNGGIETALQCMLQIKKTGPDEEEVINAGAKLMETVARFNPESIMKSPHAVQSMLKGVNYTQVPRVQTASAKVLDRIAMYDPGLEMIVSQGGIEQLITAMAPGKATHEEMLRPIFRLLERLAQNPNYIKQIRDCHGVEALVAQLDAHSDNEFILRAGGRLLAKIADTDIEEAIRRMGGKIGDAERQHLVGLLANLALQPDNVEKIVAAGGIQAILTGFDKFNPQTKAAALRALQRIADTGPVNANKIIQAGGVPVIINALKTANGDEEILKAATQALTGIVSAGLDQANFVHKNGGILAVLEQMMKFPNNEGFTASALDFIEKLCAVGFSSEELVKMGAVDAIYAAMKAGIDNSEVQEKGFNAFTALMSTPDDKANRFAGEAIGSNKDLEVLPQSLQTHENDKNVVKAGVQTLAKLAQIDSVKQKLAQMGSIEQIISAAYAQMKMEMLGQSRLSTDPAYNRNIKSLLSALVNKNQVMGLGKGLLASGIDAKTPFLQKIAVFSLVNEFSLVMMNEGVTQALSQSLLTATAEAKIESIVDHSVAIWSFAKSGLEAMGELVDNGAPKNLLAASKTHTKEADAVIAVFRSLAVFANREFNGKLLALGAIENSVTGMRSNPQSPEVQEAAIDLMIALASTDAAAADVCFKGGSTQVGKMIQMSASGPEFERAVEKGVKLLYRVATVDKNDIKDQLKNQGTVPAVTTAMSAFPTNGVIIEFGGRILSLLMDPEDVGKAIDEVVKLTMDLGVTKKPDAVFEQLGQKAATVGFLSLNPLNKTVMKTKDAAGVTTNAIAVSKSKPQTVKREVAVMNEYRALGQISSVLGPNRGTIDELLKSLAADEEHTSLLEKVGILEAIKYLTNDPKALDELLNKKAVDTILDLLKQNRSDERFLLAALDALSGLMSNDKGVNIMSKAGGNDLIFGILRDDAETLDHKSAAAALVGLNKLAKLKMNAEKLIEDGAVDVVTSTVAQQCEQSEEARPKVVGAAAALLTTLVEQDAQAADQIVKKDAIKKIMDIVASSPDYLSDAECMQNVGNLLEALSKFDELRPKLRDMGAVELMMQAMNMNPGNEELEHTGQRVLQKLVGGDANALEQTLQDYDRLLEIVRKKPNNTTGLERLNRAGINLGNLMMVDGVVDAKGAAKIVNRAIDTYNVVEKAPTSVGPIRDQVMETALNNMGKSTLIDGAMNEVDIAKAMSMLSKAMNNHQSPELQIQALNALGKFLSEDERAVAAAVKLGMISQLQDVYNKSASPQVKAAAQKALENIREQVGKKPALLLVNGPQNDSALAALLNTVNDPKDLDDLLNKITDAPYGADALMRLAMSDLGQLDSAGNPLISNDLRKALLKALGNAPPGVLNIPPNMLSDILKMLKDPNVDSEQKAQLLKLLAESKMNPEMAKAIMDNKGVESLLDIISNSEGKDPNLLLNALQALGQFGTDPMLAKHILALGGAQSIAEVMKKHAGNKQMQIQGFETLANLKDTVGGPEHIALSPDALSYLEGALNGLDPGARGRAQQLVDDLANLYNGEMEPMVVSRFDNMLEVLNAAKDWRELHDPKTGKPYYYNVVTKETTWEKPHALIAAENALKALEKLAQQAPAEIDQMKLRAAIGHFNDQVKEPLRLKALAKALAALASNEKNRDAMVQHGVLGALVNALNGGNVDREFILAAIALLNQFAKHPVYKEQICKLGGIKALIAIMIRYMSDEEIVEKCEQCLANLAYKSALCVTEIMECKGPEAVGQAFKTYKDSILVNLNAMTLLSNLMFQNEENKRLIGDLLRDRIVAVLRRLYKDANVFKQTGRALGNIAFIDDHIRHVVRLNAVRSLIVAMDYHKGDNGALKLGIDVIGNFASIDEEAYEQQIREGKMVSVVSTIWHEGGARKIVDTFGETNDPIIVASCIKSLMHLLEDEDVRKKLIGMNIVQMIFHAMQKYNYDTDVTDFCIDSIELLSTNHEGIQSIFENDGVSILLQQMELHIDRTDYVQTVTQALVNMANLRDAHRDLSMRVLNDLAQQGGIDTLINVMENNVQDDKYVRITLRLLTLLTALRNDVSMDVAQKGMRIILKCVNTHEKDPEVLKVAYQLIGLLAFEPKNLKIIVQYGGITLIVNSILNFPSNEGLVKRSIQTLDNIAMASQEHSNIVKEARGKDVIEELIKTYETIPGEKAKEVVKSCKAALLSLTQIENRKLNKKLFFVDKEENDPLADPLKNHRNLLKTGDTVTYWKNGSSKPAHLYVKDTNFQIVWKVPGNKKVLGRLDLRNLTGVRAGNMPGHGRKSNPANAFALVSTESKNAICFECQDEAERNRWQSALEALRNTYRNNNKKWLHL